MPDRSSPRKLYIIHHSHTDIGYTENQGRIERWHIDFIRQALKIIEKDSSNNGDNGGFKWNIECFWAVDRFLQSASKREILALQRAVQSGKIGLSGNYLNLNELLDYDILSKMLTRSVNFGRSVGAEIDSAMTADINGFGWGFSQALHENGIDNLFTCIHTHHGMYPLIRHMPFWWETPNGNRILVWNGEHYHYGNELGVVPGAVSSYIIKDECDADMIFSDHWRVAEIRIPRVFEALSKDNYPYNFLPVMASGLRTDNAPPNYAIIDFIHRWNDKHGDRVEARMVTLSEFFSILRKEPVDIPTYRGDWPDWWSDGLAGQPEYTRAFRQSQRDLKYYHYLTKKFPGITKQDTEQAEHDLTLYSEHTFSHSDSMSQPWHFMVHSISSRKKSFATAAYEQTEALLDKAYAALGATGLSANMPLYFKVINPLPTKVSGLAAMAVGHFEYHELNLHKGAEIIDTRSGNTVPHQTSNIPGAMEYAVLLELEPGEERVLEIRPGETSESHDKAETTLTATSLETPQVKIQWKIGKGITSWLDRSTGAELIRPDRDHDAFTPVYEITPVPDPTQICAVRGAMGLNRKGKNAIRSRGVIESVGDSEIGDIYTRVELNYRAEGCSLFKLILKAYINEPRVDIAVRMHKESRWEPENLYLSLPFTTGSDKHELWFDKSGADVRPGIDQIPGTLTDFYSIQEGLALVSENLGTIIATPDTNLIQLGDLAHGERQLFDPALDFTNRKMYAWLMTNYWETNFQASLGGFYEFRFTIKSSPELNDAKSALQSCRDLNHGLHTFRLAKKPIAENNHFTTDIQSDADHKGNY